MAIVHEALDSRAFSWISVSRPEKVMPSGMAGEVTCTVTVSPGP